MHIVNKWKTTMLTNSDMMWKENFSAPAQLSDLKQVLAIKIIGVTVTNGLSVFATCSQCHSIVRPNTLCLACSPCPWVMQ